MPQCTASPFWGKYSCSEGTAARVNRMCQRPSNMPYLFVSCGFHAFTAARGPSYARSEEICKFETAQHLLEKFKSPSFFCIYLYILARSQIQLMKITSIFCKESKTCIKKDDYFLTARYNFSSQDVLMEIWMFLSFHWYLIRVLICSSPHALWGWRRRNMQFCLKDNLKMSFIQNNQTTSTVG